MWAELIGCVVFLVWRLGLAIYQLCGLTTSWWERQQVQQSQLTHSWMCTHTHQVTAEELVHACFNLIKRQLIRATFLMPAKKELTFVVVFTNYFHQLFSFTKFNCFPSQHSPRCNTVHTRHVMLHVTMTTEYYFHKDVANRNVELIIISLVLWMTCWSSLLWIQSRTLYGHTTNGVF